MPARINIFIASPSDVVLERQYAVDVIGDFNTTLGESLGLQLVPRRWEQASPDLGDPQDLINEIARDADLVVVIFWRRLGTPTREHEGCVAIFQRGRRETCRLGD